MFRIAKKFRFDAAHWLHNLPRDHKCSRLHGHSYTVELGLASVNLDLSGFVVDYGDLREFRELIDTLDHRLLLAEGQHPQVFARDAVFLPVRNTSAEELARWLFEMARGFYGDLVAYVEVRETETSYARYEAEVATP